MIFFVYFHQSSDIGPNMFFVFLALGTFFTKAIFSFSFSKLLWVVFSGDSKLLEKTLPCTERARTFDLGHILNLDFR